MGASMHGWSQGLCMVLVGLPQRQRLCGPTTGWRLGWIAQLAVYRMMAGFKLVAGLRVLVAAAG